MTAFVSEGGSGDVSTIFINVNDLHWWFQTGGVFPLFLGGNLGRVA